MELGFAKFLIYLYLLCASFNAGAQVNWMAVPVSSVNTRGSCNSSCVNALNTRDGNFLRWIACTDGLSTSTEYDNPTDLEFDIPNQLNYSEATLTSSLYSSGKTGYFLVSCVDRSGNELANIFMNKTPLSTTPITYGWDIPASCNMNGTVIIRFKKLSSNCLAMDFASLNIKYTNSSYINPSQTIEGYSDKISAYPGDIITFMVHSPSSYNVQIISSNQTFETVYQFPQNFPSQLQYMKSDDYRHGTNWRASFQFTIPQNLPSGIYGARLYNGTGDFLVTFVVKKTPADISKHDLLVLASTNTWNAYNGWGHASLYGYSLKDPSGRTYSPAVSFLRPNPGADFRPDMGHLANGEKHLLRWLDKNGISYHMISDLDLHLNPSILNVASMVVLNTHNEYWTEIMYDALKNYQNQGGSILYLSANGVYWKTTIQGNQMEVRKNSTFHFQTKELGGQWREFNKPESKILGTQYIWNSGITAGFKVLLPNHWLFDGCNLNSNSVIGSTGLNTYNNTQGGGSGWEIDQMTPFTPNNVQPLAKGQNGGQGGADLIYYYHPAGGGVLAGSSITFTGALAQDPSLTKLVLNFISHFNN